MQPRDTIFLSFAVSILALAVYTQMTSTKIRNLVAKVNSLADERDAAKADLATAQAAQAETQAQLDAERAANAEINDPALEAEVDAAIARS